MTVPLALYRGLTHYLRPLLNWHLRRRARTGKEDPARLEERCGAGPAPPPGFSAPIWIHAASVGEAQSALIVIDILRNQTPDLPILMTTGTLTSAQLMARRLPKGCEHRYLPLDHPDWGIRFLATWTPRAAIWIESELWPNLLQEMNRRNIPAILLNARMSERSARRWQVFPKSARKILSTFTRIVAESADAAARYRRLSGQPVEIWPNLKFAAKPLPVPAQDREKLAAAIGSRPVWVYASTHADEEKLAAEIHDRLKRDHLPGLLTLIVPRHPARRADIESSLKILGLKTAWRSDQETPAPDDDLFLVDTMGELGLFFSLTPLAVIGRSFSHDGGGGHNPIEAAQLGAFPLSGPMVQNLYSLFTPMEEAGAVEIHPSPVTIEERLHHLLTHPDELKRRADHAKDVVTAAQTEITERLTALLRTLPTEGTK